MCRHLGYVGPPLAVGEILTRGPHSLRTQSWAPRDMRGGGTINADGFGVAWWVPAPTAPEDHGAGVIWHGGHTPDVIDAAREDRPRPNAPGPGPIDPGELNANDPAPPTAGSGRQDVGEPASPAVGLGGHKVGEPASATVGLGRQKPGEPASPAVGLGGQKAGGAASPAVGSGGREVDESASAAVGPGVSGGPEPAHTASVTSRYRNAAPIWTDPAVDEVLPQIRSRAVVAALRSATVGLPLERAACAPFTHGRWAFSHNGAIPGWRDTFTTLAAKFESPSLLEAESLTDSAMLWVILRGLLEEKSVAADAALRQVVAGVLEHSPTARLNLLLGDGETLWATTWHHSLSVLVTDEFAVVASEPYDDDERWRPIADRQLVVAGPGRVTVEPLDIDTGRATS
ncbi:class II glutamine amidotransferase [Nocardia sp. NPDC050406]|uniref:class II glutamine amidotransferase n=1 Tax=Nocardia sp. NPDC050406 TaxID=3364318 RepID=UPI0037B976A0